MATPSTTRDHARPSMSSPTHRQASSTTSISTRSQRLRVVGNPSALPPNSSSIRNAHSPQHNPQQSIRSCALNQPCSSPPPLYPPDSSPEMHLAALPAKRRTNATTSAPTDDSPVSSRPSLHLVDPDIIVQASNPAHPDHHLWLQRNRASSPTSRRKKVPLLDYDDPAFTDSSAGPSWTSHEAARRSKVQGGGAKSGLAPPLHVTGLIRPSSSIASPSSSSDEALSQSRPHTPRSKRRSGNRSPTSRQGDGQGSAVGGSSSEAKAAARKRRRERREMKKALVTPPPPPALPPRVSSTQPVCEDDNVEGLPPLEKAIYPLPTSPQSLAPYKAPNVIGHRSSSNTALRDSSQARANHPPVPPPPPAKAVRLLGGDPVTFPGDDGAGYPSFARPEFRGPEPEQDVPNYRRGRSASLDLLRESLNFFPLRSNGQSSSKTDDHQLLQPPLERSVPSRIRASFDAVRPRLLSARSNAAIAAPDFDVDSDASETAATKGKLDSKVRKGLRSIRSVLRLKPEASAAPMATSRSVSDNLAAPITGPFARSTQSMDVSRGLTPFRQAAAPLIPPLPPSATHRQLEPRSASYQRLSLVGEEMDVPEEDRTSSESGALPLTNPTLTPNALDVHAYTPRSISPTIPDSRRPSIGRVAPQLQTVLEVSHDSPATQTRTLSKAEEKEQQLSQSRLQRPAGRHQRSVTEASEASSPTDSRRPATRMRHLSSFTSLRSLPSSTKLHVTTATARESAPQDPWMSPPVPQTLGFTQGRKRLFTSLWNRTSSAPGLKMDRPPEIYPGSEQGPGASPGSFGFNAPTSMSSMSVGSSLRSTLEGVYSHLHEPFKVNESHLAPNASRLDYHPYSSVGQSSTVLGLGIGEANGHKAVETQGENTAPPPVNLSDPFSVADWSASEDFKSASTTPKPGRFERLHSGVTSLQAENAHRQAFKPATGQSGGLPPKSRVAIPAAAAPTELKADGKSKRSPFLEVVAAGRRSFSKDRSRQASNSDFDQPLPESSRETPTIHKSLGPMLLSEARRPLQSVAIDAAEEHSLANEDDFEPWDGMEVEEGLAMHSSASSNALHPGTSEHVRLQKAVSAPSWDSTSYRRSPPSPATSPSASPSSRQRGKSNPDLDKPLPLVAVDSNGNGYASNSASPSGPHPEGFPSATSPPQASSPGSPSLSLGEQSQRSFGGRRASQGRRANPPASLRLSPSMQEVLTTPPLPSKDGYGISSATTGPSPSMSFKSALDSPGPMKTWRSASTTPKSSTGLTFIFNDPVGASAPAMKKSDSTPAKGRTSFSMDRDRSPVASPYVNHASGSATLGRGVRNAFKKLGLSPSTASGAVSSQSMLSLGSTMSSRTANTLGSNHMKEGISSESYLFADSPSADNEPERLASSFGEIPSSRPKPSAHQWSSFNRSASSGHLSNQDSSLAAARAATQMLQAQMEDLLPTPTATPLTSTAPTRLGSAPVSPFILGRPSIDSDPVRAGLGDKADRTGVAERTYSNGSASGSHHQFAAASATAPSRPQRSRPVATPEGIPPTRSSPGANQLPRSEGASSSSGSYATPTSARLNDCDDILGFDAMLRAQKAREEEMFREITARSRSRNREGGAPAAGKAPAINGAFSLKTPWNLSGSSNVYGNDDRTPQHSSDSPGFTLANGAGGQRRSPSSSSPQQSKEGMPSYHMTKSDRAPYMLFSKS